MLGEFLPLARRDSPDLARPDLVMTSPEASQLTEVHRIFAVACELPVGERTAFLDRECGARPELRSAVEELLGHFDQAPAFLAATPKPRSEERRHPDSIGPFRILGTLGQGGMGIVFRAEQDRPRRMVALKVLTHGLAGDSARARFAREIDTLGRLQHPCIAQIFAAGLWESALGPQPYFAMELVEGRPLTEFARRHELSVSARCALFAQVCDAVHHAHDAGIVHRDLKPSNVLVDLDPSGAPRARILDFGIARSLRGEEDATLLTRTGDLLGTLAYMSPEQINGDASEVDARSDVYALGVMLYELLGGRLPLALEGCSLTKAARIVQAQEPVPLARLDRALRGDLDTIVATALAKEPAMRYVSASALGADLRRSLRHEPIRARPQTALYHLGRFARRNRVLVAGAVATTLALVAGLVGTTLFARREARERDRAESNAAELRRTLYGSQMLLAGASLDLAGGLARTRDLVDAWLPAPGSVDLRGFEWHWLDAMANAQERTVTTGRDVRRLWCPEGDAMFALTRDGVVRLDAITGQERDVVCPGGALAAAVRPDGRQFLVADGRTVRAFELPSGNLQWTIPGPDGDVGLCYSHDGGFAMTVPASTPRRALQIEWRDAADGGLRRVVPAEGEDLDPVMAFSPDGKRFAYSTKAPNTLLLVDTRTLACTDLGNFGGVFSLEFSPDSDSLALGNARGKVFVFSLNLGTPTEPKRMELRGHRENRVLGLRWSADGGALVTSGEDGEVWLWHVATGTGRLVGAHDSPVPGIDWSADGQRLVSASHDRIRTWLPARKSARRDLSREAGHGGGPVSLTADGSLLVGGGARAVKSGPDGGLWVSSVRDTTTGAIVQEEPGETVSMHEGTKRLAFCQHGVIAIRALGEPAVLARLDLGISGVLPLPLAWSPAGDALAIALPEDLVLWRPFTSEPPTRHGFPGVVGLDWHPTGKRLTALLSDSTSVVEDLDVEGGRLALRSRVEVGPWVRSFARSPDGQRVAFGARDGFVEVRDADMGKVLQRFHAHSQRLLAIAWSPDGTRLATGGADQCVRLYETERFQEVLSLATAAEVVSLAWSRDGRSLMSACRFGKAVIFDAGVKDAAPR